jgi:tetratricopeptide (TPR) repeat protein
MKIRKLVFGMLLLGVLSGSAAWFGWRWYTTPSMPKIELTGADEEVVEAVEAAQQEARHRPRSGDTWGKLGMVLAIHGYHEEGKRCFILAERIDPHNPRWPYLRGVLLMHGSPHEGIPLMRRALGLAETSEQLKAIHFRLALALVEEDELEETEEHLEALRRLDPDSPRLHLGLGLLANARHDQRGVREHLSTLTNSPFARKRACSLLATLTDGDKELTRGYEERAVQLPRDFTWPDPFLVEMNRCKADQRSGIAQFRRLESEGKDQQALYLLRRLVSESPDADVCIVMGERLLQRNELDEAEVMFRAALRFEPENIQAHYLLGSALLKRGEDITRAAGAKERALGMFREALAAADAVLGLQSDHADAYVLRARALKHLDRNDESLRALREAVVCRPEFAEMHMHLGEALAEAGQLTEALKHLENAVKLARPDDPLPLKALKKWQAKQRP